MLSSSIPVANLKCSGCAHTISSKLSTIAGVKNVKVNVEECLVSVDYIAPASHARILQMLHNLGYPEATAENGLLLQVKSYASCMIGKLNQ